MLNPKKINIDSIKFIKCCPGNLNNPIFEVYSETDYLFDISYENDDLENQLVITFFDVKNSFISLSKVKEIIQYAEEYFRKWREEELNYQAEYGNYHNETNK